MAAKLVACLLVAQAVFAQEASNDQVRKLRFRRPRPKLVDVENPDGDLLGSPVPQRISEQFLEEGPLARPQTSGNAALDALIATAQREDPRPLEIQEVPTATPLLLDNANAQPPVAATAAPQRPAAASNPRRANLPRRRPNRPRQQDLAIAEGEEPVSSRDRLREDGVDVPVGTLERYSHKNDDGSFTFGYVAADGSFREETRGADCITRGKYGYIDPEGVKREYTYTSGLPCEVGEDGDLTNLQSLEDGQQAGFDVVDPSERFRQTQSVQLQESEIPEAAKRQRLRPRPVPQNDQRQQAQPQPRPRPAPVRNGNPSGSAFQNLLTIADEGPAASAPLAPTPRPVPVRRPAPAAGSFDFDAELDGFTLNRPSLTFEQDRGNQQKQPGQVSPNFQSQLVFNQNSGTFQTELNQNVVGGPQLNLKNEAAPFKSFPSTTPSPSTTINDNSFTLTRVAPTSPSPATRLSPQPTGTPQPVIPAGTIQLDFQPLNIPTNFPTSPASPAPVAATTPSPAPSPAPSSAASPAPGGNNFFVFQPFAQGTPAPSPRPVANPSPAPLNSNAFVVSNPGNGAFPRIPLLPEPSAVPVNQASRPAPDNFPRPAGPPPAVATSAARPTPSVNVQPARPSPSVVALPAPVTTNNRPITFPASVQPSNGAPSRPQAPIPLSAQAQPSPVVVRPQSQGPQLQFGFQPVSQQQQQPGQPRPAPFTAFRGGAPVPPRPAQPQQPQRFAPPPQPQQQQQQGLPQLQVFNPLSQLFGQQAQSQPQQQLRPAQFRPGQAQPPNNPFSVFRGA